MTSVVWDIGGILYRPFTEVLLDAGRRRGWPIERIPLGPTSEVPDLDYTRMCEGDIDEPEYARIVAERLRTVGVPGEPLREIDWAEHRRPETWDAIRRIHRSGVRQAVLTNDASRWLGPDWWEEWEAAGWFDVMVDVATLGVRKPAPEPYLAVAERLGEPPSACLFVDDIPVNCRGAEAVGMASLWFDVTDAATSLRKLDDALGL